MTTMVDQLKVTMTNQLRANDTNLITNPIINPIIHPTANHPPTLINRGVTVNVTAPKNVDPTIPQAIPRKTRRMSMRPIRKVCWTNSKVYCKPSNPKQPKKMRNYCTKPFQPPSRGFRAKRGCMDLDRLPRDVRLNTQVIRSRHEN